MDTQEYNGWTNYATWVVNLEMFDGGDWSEHSPDDLRQFVEDHIEEQSSGPARNYAMRFIADVNWYEIASHYMAEV